MIILINLTLAYIQFMSQLGDLKDHSLCLNQLPIIFAQSIIKEENGKIIATDQVSLLDQLESARKYAYPWTMEILDIITDNDKNTSVVRFTWNSQKIGRYITTAILRFDENYKIIEINEVYNKFAG